MVLLCFSKTFFTVTAYGSLLIGTLPGSCWALSAIFHLDSPSLQHSLENPLRQQPEATVALTSLVSRLSRTTVP